VFNLTGSELVVILLLALVVLGPDRLPEAIRRVGRIYAELKRMSSGLEQEIRSVIDEPMHEIRSSLKSTEHDVPETKNGSPPIEADTGAPSGESARAQDHDES